jgi:hypothetical protein
MEWMKSNVERGSRKFLDKMLCNDVRHVIDHFAAKFDLFTVNYAPFCFAAENDFTNMMYSNA